MAKPHPPEQTGEAEMTPRDFRCPCGFSGELWSIKNDHREYEYRVLVEEKTGKHLAHKLVPKKTIL